MIIDLTVKLLAVQLKISIDYLICQFADLGISKTALDHVSPEEKNILFTHIYTHKKQVGLLNQLTLQRKTHSTLNIFGSGGKSKKVQIEVRKKHTYIPCNSTVLSGIKSKQKDTENLVSSFTEDSQLSNDVTKNSVFLQEKVDVNDISIISHDKCILNKESNIMLIPKQLGNNSSVKKQYNKKVKNVIHHSSKKNMEDVSLGTSYISDINRDSNLIIRSSTIGNKKQTNGNDRRVRVRQRLRPSFNKIRNHKVNVNLKNRKNNDHVFEIKYDESDDRHFFRGIKSKQRKPSILTHAFKKPVQVINRDVVIGEIVTVSELANKMAVKSSQVIKALMKLGIMATINQTLDQKIAQLVAEEMGHHVILRRESDLESKIINDRDTAIMSSSGDLLNNLEFRAPVVTVMGHVDHGKTSLLDYIRSSKLVDLEAGGITQRIGAYCVDIPNKGMITFLDTPGHAAFSGMRIRGIQITDIVVLVVAVDDGVMPQTIEAIQHIKSAGVSMIVALNKIDKVNVSNFDKIKTQLSKQGIISEEWGGETQFINISAKLGHGVDDLLDAILLESEVLELKAVRNGMATGIVIESFLDKGRGPVAVTLIREGTLKSGDVILCGSEFGRVRAMRNEFGLNINLAGPSIPVEVFGLSGLPYAGDIMTVVRDERKAREVALYRQGKYRSVKLAEKEKSKLKNMFDISSEKNIQVLDFNVVLKADVQGSVEAIVDVLKSLSNVNVKVNIVDSGVGGITETDVSMAVATRSVLLGFNVRPDVLARRIIELERVSFYYYSIIYDLINDVKKLVDCILAPKCASKNVAVAEVRDIFRLPKLGNIAGCMILEGVVKRHSKVRVLRKKLVIYEGEVESLRRFKDDVNEVRAGMECGIAIKNWTDISLGDYIEIFEEINNN